MFGLEKENVGWVSYKGGDSVPANGDFPVDLQVQNNNTQKRFIGISVTGMAAQTSIKVGSTGFNVTSIDGGSVGTYTGIIPIGVPVGVNENLTLVFHDDTGSGFTTPSLSLIYTYKNP